jgi:hypothetical protein
LKVSGTLSGSFSLSRQESKAKSTRTKENGISAPDDSEHRTVVAKDRARQGVTGHHVRYVLGFGLAAVIVAFAVIYFAYFG